MKKLSILITVSLLISYISTANIITVDNNPTNNAADYTNLQTAVDAAAVGDTILVSGSATDYGVVTINKKLVLFGTGFNPNNQDGLISMLSTVTFAYGNFGADDPAGSHLEGFNTGFINMTDANGIHDITITRNRIFSGSGCINLTNGANNIIIKHNVLVAANTTPLINADNTATNIQITNNILNFGSSNVCITGFANNTIAINNNLFLSCIATNNNTNVVFSNNIFYGSTVGTGTGNCSGCTFVNNISFGTATIDFDYGTNTTSGNIEGMDPLFVNAADFSFDYTDDYRLGTGSPGLSAGSDGTDIGIMGGSSPWPITDDVSGFVHSPFPHLPQVTEFIILNQSVPQNGTLNIQFKGKIVDN